MSPVGLIPKIRQQKHHQTKLSTTNVLYVASKSGLEGVEQNVGVLVCVAGTYLLIVRPNVTWTSAIRVFLTHLNTVTDRKTDREGN